MTKLKELIELTKSLLQRVKKDSEIISSLKSKISEYESKMITEDQEKEISQLLVETKEILTGTV